MANTFGWDLLYNTIEKDVKSNQDVLVSLTHFVLISNGFKCIGLGESKVLEGGEVKSEALPKGWSESYTLRYLHQGHLYNLKGTSLDDGVMLNLIRVKERTVSLTQLNTRAVLKRTGTLDEMIPNHETLMDQIKKQLIDKIVASDTSREMSCQTEPETPNNPTNNQESTPFTPAYFPEQRINPHFGGLSDPFLAGVGRRDLDPFGVGMDPLRINRPPIIPGGGGMLFSPPQGGIGPGLPPPGVPAGARFDPYRPPDVDRFPQRGVRRPDNDELPPPGYDDMFM